MSKAITISAKTYNCTCGQCGYTLCYELEGETPVLKAKMRFCLSDGTCPYTTITLTEDQKAMAPDALMQSLHAAAVAQWEAAT